MLDRDAVPEAQRVIPDVLVDPLLGRAGQRREQVDGAVVADAEVRADRLGRRDVDDLDDRAAVAEAYVEQRLGRRAGDLSRGMRDVLV